MFWRRGGSRFDVRGGSPLGWLLRIVIFLFVLFGIILMARLSLPAASAEEKSLPEAVDAGWKGKKVCEVLFENEDMRAARCAFPPGVGHERHWHKPHWGYIVEGGVMRITDKGGTRDVATKTGDSWWSPGVEWHEVLNVGETTSVYLIIEPKEHANE